MLIFCVLDLEYQISHVYTNSLPSRPSTVQVAKFLTILAIFFFTKCCGCCQYGWARGRQDGGFNFLKRIKGYNERKFAAGICIQHHKAV